MLQTTNAPYPVPDRLPLLEGLCWNITNPYQLTPEQMLEVYESRWGYVEVLGNPDINEKAFIHYLCQKYQKPFLIPEGLNMDKKQFFQQAEEILECLDKDFLTNSAAYFGGGTMLALEQDRYRLSYDLDFICNLDSYNQIRRWFNDNTPQQLFTKNSVSVGEIRTSPYNIRINVRANPNSQPIKLEFVAETRFKLNNCEMGTISNLPYLSKTDRFTSKLLANSDRWMNSTAFSRDLIDLIILRQSQPIPPDSIAQAEINYPVVEPLIEALTRFKERPELRTACYTALKIEDRVAIIDGLDLLSSDYGLPKTKRSFTEMDFGYLKDSSSKQTNKQNKRKQQKDSEQER